MRLVTSLAAFFVVFVIVFVLMGWFVLPHVPPTPDRMISIFELAYWIPNWPGYIAGAILGGMSTWSTWKRGTKQTSEGARQ